MLCICLLSCACVQGFAWEGVLMEVRGTLWSRFPLPFSEFLGCQATNVHRYLMSRLTCAGMFLLIRGLIVIFKINDVFMG